MIDFASRQRTPRKHLIGLTVVVVLHGLLFWAINSGLARKFVKVIKGPVEAVLLEETKPDMANFDSATLSQFMESERCFHICFHTSVGRL